MVEPNNNNEKFRIPDLIIKKRNGQKLSKDEIDFFVESVVSGHVQESQIGKHGFFLFSGTSLTKFYHAMFFFLSNVRRIFSFIFKCNFFLLLLFPYKTCLSFILSHVLHFCRFFSSCFTCFVFFVINICLSVLFVD